MNKKFIRLLFCMLFLLTACLAGCGRSREDVPRLTDYRLYTEDGQAPFESAEFLTTLAKDRHTLQIKTTDAETGSRIVLIADETAAERFGLSLDGISAHGFQIRSKDSSLYLLAQNERSLKRACSFLLAELTDKDGTLLLADGEVCADTGSHIKETVTVGSTPLSAYTIIYNEKNLADAAYELAYYLQQTGEDILPVRQASQAGDTAHTITLAIDEGLAGQKPQIAIRNGCISITGAEAASVYDGVCLFLNTYAGWAYAGSEAAHISNASSNLRIPETAEERTPWIEEREAIVTLWNINYSRGIYLNSNTSLKNDVISFSDDQLYEYVKMLKFCGFTGIQVTDMCSAWAGAGSYEVVHDKLRTLADAAHSLDMHFTLWVWGSEFTGYGWIDNSVTYSFEGYQFAYENPDVLATFDKYYSIYAELADCCDRIIAHYYDPGNLTQSEDVAYFAKMLRDKFTAVNPDIDFGVSCWVDIFSRDVLVQELGNDITLYESGYHDNPEDYTDFRSFLATTGCRLGTWAWNTCEMEIDQMAQMNFNPDIIRSVYQTARNYDGIYKPSYWSEMDSYHVLNVFSLYYAAQLLIDPDTEHDTLLYQIAQSAVGDSYAADFEQILLLLQDSRSGSSWDTYWWNSDSYLLKSPDYPAEDILARCNTYIPVLQEMIDNKLTDNTIPLPISLQDVLRLMQPHLEQIKRYAEFRIALADLEAAYDNGASPEELTAALAELATPIPEYNCIIGAWGQNEARAQVDMIRDFCKRTGLSVPVDATYKKNAKNRIYSYFETCQKGKNEPYILYFPYYQYGIAYGGDETYSFVQEMADEGLLVIDEDKNGAYLANWESYQFHFNE